MKTTDDDSNLSPPANTAPATPTKAGRPLGRPRKADPPRVAYHELDRILVMGEVVDDGEGHGPKTVYPSYRDLGARYGVSHSVIAAYAKHHRCLERREWARRRVESRVEDKLIEVRSSSIVDTQTKLMRSVDQYFQSFDAAMNEGRVRCDSVTDFNTMARLRVFLDGGPDARSEVRGSISLEELQVRYDRAMRAEAEATPAMRGIVPRRPRVEHDATVIPPAQALEAPAAEADGHFAEGCEAREDDGAA